MFQNDLERGRPAEEAVKTHLRKRGHIVTDVTNAKEFFDIDTDLLIESSTGQKTTLEVKADYRISETKNFFLELNNIRATGIYKGWFLKTQAEYVCVYDMRLRKGYVLDFAKLKEAAPGNARIIKFYNRSDNCASEGYIFPVGQAEKLGLVVYSWIDSI